MQVTFTLNSAYTGATFVAGPFNISGTTTGGTTTQLATGVTKNELATGYTINNIDNATSGGTIASTGTCSTTQSWSSGIVPPTVTLEIYGKDLDITPENATITYSINSGSTVNLVTITPLPNNCGLIGTITGLSQNDTVQIVSVNTYPLSGTNSSTCPNAVGGSSSYLYTVSASSGTVYAAIAIDSGNPL